MLKTEKQAVVEQLTERLKTSETLIVADYRGLTNKQIDGIRDELFKHGARFTVAKNTLARRAAEAAGSTALLELLEGPTAIAFVQLGGDPVAALYQGGVFCVAEAVPNPAPLPKAPARSTSPRRAAARVRARSRRRR